MQDSKLAFMAACVFAAALLSGCGTSDPPPTEPTAPPPVEDSSCQLSPPPNTLWSLAQCCAKDLHSDPSCRVYDAKDEYVIVKDHEASKPQGYLLIPTVRISGIEDPRVTSQPFVDLWEDGWFRSYSYPAKPASKTALAINSEVQRSENQLHIHMSCVRADVDQFLQAHDKDIPLYPAKFVSFNLPPRNNPYEIVKVDALTNGNSPFEVIQSIPGVSGHMGDQSIALVGTQRTDRYYVLNGYYNKQTKSGGAAEELLDQTCSAADTALQFVPVTPCRVVDTRGADGPFGGPAIAGRSSRSFVIPTGACNTPPTAAAYSLNVTLVPKNGPVEYLTVWPSGAAQPAVSTMNSGDGRTKADAAIVPAGFEGGVSVYVTNTANVLIDINGYFTFPSDSTLEFYPLTPCRLVDTRGNRGALGGPYLSPGVERDFPILQSSCIPQGVSPNAYSLNFTAVPHPAGHQLGYLSVWPEGEQQPEVSTLNNYTGTIVANAAIVPAGSGGGVAVYPDQNTDLLIDINGYFGPAGQKGLSLHPEPPCRVLDTRNVGQGRPFSGELTVNVTSSPCPQPRTAQAYVFNATVVPSGSLGYLTLWPDHQTEPVVSTLNAIDGWTTSNMAIVPTTNGSIDAYADGLTQLILDISSYFAP